MSLTKFALRWILMHETVTCAIPGAKRPEQVEENMSASDLPPLSVKVMQRVKDLYEEKIRPLVRHYWKPLVNTFVVTAEVGDENVGAKVLGLCTKSLSFGANHLARGAICLSTRSSLGFRSAGRHAIR